MPLFDAEPPEEVVPQRLFRLSRKSTLRGDLPSDVPPAKEWMAFSDQVPPERCSVNTVPLSLVPPNEVVPKSCEVPSKDAAAVRLFGSRPSVQIEPTLTEQKS